MADPTNEDARANLPLDRLLGHQRLHRQRPFRLLDLPRHRARSLSPHYDITHGSWPRHPHHPFLTYVLDAKPLPPASPALAVGAGRLPKGKGYHQDRTQKGIKRLGPQKYSKTAPPPPTTLTEIGIDDTRFAEMAPENHRMEGRQDGLLHGFVSLRQRPRRDLPPRPL